MLEDNFIEKFENKYEFIFDLCDSNTYYGSDYYYKNYKGQILINEEKFEYFIRIVLSKNKYIIHFHSDRGYTKIFDFYLQTENSDVIFEKFDNYILTEKISKRYDSR